MSKNGGYIGKIKNSGAQVVKAPVNPGGKKGNGSVKKGNGSVKKGNDLRTGK